MYYVKNKRKMPAIRDPVHSWIKCSENEQKIIDSPLFQRLHWVSQLNSVKQVFLGGVHTRFLHSLGVMKLAGQYLSHLLEDNDVPVPGVLKAYYIQLARLAGLLHDIGHGPFSHAFDRAIYQQLYNVRDGGHDFHRLTMVKSSFLRPLIEGCGIDVNHLIAVWNSETEEYKNTSGATRFMFDIIRSAVQGPLGADRMDFTLRDSYFTGTSHLGTIASCRIITNSSIRRIGDKVYLHYHFKCLSDIIQALSGRYYMYDSVYLHKTSGAANVLIEEMLLKSAKHLNIIERTKNLEEFQWLNDSTIIGEIMAYRGDEPEMLKAQTACKRLLQRRLPKLLAEIMVHKNTEFKKEIYLQKYSESLQIPKEDLVVTRTRAIHGIDPRKFDEHGLRFWVPKNKLHDTTLQTENTEDISLTCQEALEKIKYTEPREPYYLVRVYSLD